LPKDREALLNLVGPTLALALSVCLFEKVPATHVEDIIAYGGTQALVLGTELVQETGVERRAFAGISGVRVGERADFFVGRILEPDVFPELLEVGVGGDVQLCDDGEECALIFPARGLVACVGMMK